MAGPLEVPALQWVLARCWRCPSGAGGTSLAAPRPLFWGARSVHDGCCSAVTTECAWGVFSRRIYISAYPFKTTYSQ